MKLLLLILFFCSCNISKRTAIKTSTITLDGSKSFDPDGWIVSYKWQQVSGNNTQLLNSDSVVARAVITEKGIYVFQISGIDNEGAKGEKKVKKTIK